jgi:putative peptidoglycan lipid II flippase
VKRAILRVVLLSGLAQAVGFLKSILIAFYFGVNPDLDGYYLSQVIPAFGVGVGIALIQTGFIPVDARLAAEGNETARFKLRGAIFWLVCFVGGILALLAALAAPWLVSVLSPEASAAVQSAATESLRVLACLLFINAMADYFGLVLNADMRFAVAALAPAANAAAGLAILYMWPEYGLTNLIWGTVIGVVLQLSIVGAAIGRGRIFWRFASQEIPWHALHQAGRQAAAIFPGVLIANLSSALPQILAARLGDGAVSTMGYALRIQGALTQVLVITVSTVLLPHFSTLVARNQWRELGHELGHIWFNVFWVGLMLPMTVGLIGMDVVHLVFARGLFDADAETSVYRAWWWLSFALLPTLWSLVLAKLFQGLFRGVLLSWLSLLGIVVLLATGTVLGRIWAVDGVAIAVVLSYATVAIACHYALLRISRHHPGLKPALLKQTVYTAAAGTLLLGMAVWILSYVRNTEAITRVLFISLALAAGGYAIHRALGTGLERTVPR